MKISVLTPSYNSGKYIERAILSVLNQDYDYWEHIIVDGGSTDNTTKILKKYDHLKWISETDEGQSDAMNKAFSMSTGDLIVYLNADDEFYPNVFRQVVDFFVKNPSTEFLYGDLTRVFIDNVEKKDSASDDLNVILDYWPCKFPLNSVCYFYRREVQIQIGEFPVNNHYTMDYWFLLKVYKSYKIYYTPVLFGKFYYFDNKSSDILEVKLSLRMVRNQFLQNNPMIALIFIIKNKILKRVVNLFIKIKREFIR